MKKVFLLLVILILFSSVSGAMNWPSDNAVMVRNFGSNESGRPVLGMVFSGDTGILAAENGEVIFSRSSNDTVSRLPSPLGSWAAVDHGDGLISIYSRYSDSSDLKAITKVERQQQIAIKGLSGWSSGNGFYFKVYDRRERRWINPALIITPQQEAGFLQIHSVDLRNAQGVLQSRNITQGRYRINVNTSIIPGFRGIIARNALIAPQRIVCLVNGAEAGSLNFESVSARDGVLMVHRNGLVPAKQVYQNFPSFETAEVFLNRGQVNLEIIVYDIAGNSRSLIHRLIVN